VKEPTTERVTITIVEVTDVGCTVITRGERFEDVYVPYGNPKAGQKFTATMTRDGRRTTFDGWERH
jgi:hypothetical protein